LKGVKLSDKCLQILGDICPSEKGDFNHKQRDKKYIIMASEYNLGIKQGIPSQFE